jgi:hypothetical protein
MANYPSRCHHIKVNGTQCGSPALRRHTLCYFHQRHHEESIALNTDRLKNARASRRNVTIDLPVLEDANSIQISLMQIMRLIITGQIDAKTAGLLLYALQTASANLPRTNFSPYERNVVLDPETVGQTPLGGYIWQDSDFVGNEKEQDEAKVKIVEKGRAVRLAKVGVEEVEEDARSSAVHTQPRSDAPQAAPPVPKRPPENVDMNEVRKNITRQIKQALPAIAAAVAHKANGSRSA